MFEALETWVLPVLRRRSAAVRVWLPTCGSGADAYSLGIFLHEQLGFGAAHVFATDRDTVAVQYARDGVYPTSELTAVSPERLQHYFTRCGAGHYRVSALLHDFIGFAIHDFSFDPPLPRLDVISCDSVLCACEPGSRDVVLVRLHNALSEEGFLCLGRNDRMSCGGTGLFESVTPDAPLFRRRDPLRRSALAAVAAPGRSSAVSTQRPANGGKSAAEELITRVAALKAATGELIDLMEAAHVALLVLDEDLRIRRFTPAVARLLHLAQDDIGSSGVPSIEAFDAGFANDVRAVLHTGRAAERSVNRAERCYLCSIHLPAKLDGVALSFVDITRQIEAGRRLEEKTRRLNVRLEQRVAERTIELRHSEERIRAILDATADAVVTVDLLGKVATFNLAAERIFGYCAAEVIGESVMRLLAVDGGAHQFGYRATSWQSYAARFVGRSHELHGHRRDGSLIPIQLSVNAVEGRGLFVAVARDMTEHKALQKEIIDVAMLEQRRIGQELHDGTQQELTGLGLLAASLAESLSRGGANTAGHLAARIARGIEDANLRVRSLARGMVPVPVDREGLMSALAELARQTTEIHALPCAFECPARVAIDNDTEATHLYRIAQEAVSNATRHARASAIWIRLEQAHGRLLLQIQDNGVGLQTPLPERRGVGLRLMEHRCGMIGGAFAIDLRADGGTCVACSVARAEHD